MGPRAGLDGGKSRPTGIRSQDRPARSSVAIPTELPGPQTLISNIGILGDKPISCNLFLAYFKLHVNCNHIVLESGK